MIHTEKEFSKDEGSVLQQFTPQHYSQMLSDMFSGKKIWVSDFQAIFPWDFSNPKSLIPWSRRGALGPSEEHSTSNHWVVDVFKSGALSSFVSLPGARPIGHKTLAVMPRSQISGASTIFRGKPTAGSWRPAKCHRTANPNICARSHKTAGPVLPNLKYKKKKKKKKKRCRKTFARQQWDESRITVQSYRHCKEIARWSLHRADIARVQHIHRKKYRVRPSRYWQHSYIHRALLPHLAALWCHGH